MFFLLNPGVPNAAASATDPPISGRFRVSEERTGSPSRHGPGRIPNPPRMRGRPAKLNAYHRIRGGSIAAPSPAPPSDLIYLRSLNQTAHEQNVDQPEHRRHPGNEIKHNSASVGPVPAPRRAFPVRIPADASAIGQSLGLSSAESTCPLDRQFAGGGAREEKRAEFRDPFGSRSRRIRAGRK